MTARALATLLTPEEAAADQWGAWALGVAA